MSNLLFLVSLSLLLMKLDTAYSELPVDNDFSDSLTFFSSASMKQQLPLVHKKINLMDRLQRHLVIIVITKQH